MSCAGMTHRMNFSVVNAWRHFHLRGQYLGTSEEFIQEWIREARALLTPAGSFREEFEEFVSSQEMEDCVGVHLRRTDACLDPSKVSATTSIQELDAALWKGLMTCVQHQGVSGVYLASDSQSYQKCWAKALRARGLRVVTWPTHWRSELRQTAAVDVIADLLSLTRCSQVIASFHSSLLSLALCFDVPIHLFTPESVELTIQ